MISGKKDGNISVEKQFVITGGSVGVTVIAGGSVGVTVIARYAFGLPNTERNRSPR